mmetsp:Transcript_30678/g.78377  ORF Transcript_30678/g.78377 Transcript_30678/m.78377 type:complete len:110 (-) Transcript_30678:919-1248(-)
MAGKSVRRAPTPDTEEEREFKLEEKIRYQLYATGERDRLKELLARKLEDSGWKDHVKELCREYIHKRGRDNVTTDDIVKAIRPEGRASVPDAIKAELLAEIKKFIHQAV